MRLQSLEIQGFKSFAKKVELSFNTSITAIVGPNGSGKSNVAEAFRFVLGEQSVKSLRGKKGEDLIFGGGKTLARQNRASVKVVFDNSDKRLPVDFETVSLERTVHRDGFNEYAINGSRVRLKDIVELLAHAHIGSSGHHIISQGEADRILSASPVERKEMVEDALGLKIYHYRKKESVKKLEKTTEHITQVESLRREIAPHLTFLRKQVEKLEKAREMKDKLAVLYLEYFKRESIYLAFTKKALADEKQKPEKELTYLEGELNKAQGLIGGNKEDSVLTEKLSHARKQAQIVAEEKDRVSRELWQIEGELSAMARLQATEQSKRGMPVTVAFADVEIFAKDVEELLLSCEKESDTNAVFALLKQARERIKLFFHVLKGAEPVGASSEDISALEQKKIDIEERLKDLAQSVHKAEDFVEEVRKEIEAGKDTSRQAEFAVYEIKAKQNEALAVLSRIKLREEALLAVEADWKRELGEAGVIIGHQVKNYETFEIKDEESVISEPRNIQEDRRRNIEKMKIRLEDAGLGTGEEVLKEYKDTSERDEFLKKELTDLHTASESLNKLIAELDVELKKRFEEGIIKINEHFGTFFNTMFGGGQARLDVVEQNNKKSAESDDEISLEESLSMDDDEDVIKVGIDVYIALPHKKTKGLVMLSGGERALTSIALLFALSQVNPPPFVILDETDAALDEANSRKYGDMIEALAKHSQLILITHNRETMSRAGMLYGVTMSGEGFSTLLSVQFESAVRIAK